MTIVRRHRWALGISVFVGLCCLFSYLIVVLSLGDAYQGVIPMYFEDGNIYRGRIQEVLNGHPNVVSSYLYEYKDAPANVAPTGEWFYAIPALMFGLSAVMWAYIALLPAALFFLVYLFTRKLLGDDEEETSILLTALASGAVVLFGFEFQDVGYLLAQLSGETPAEFIWTRPVNPITGALGLFGLLILLWHMANGHFRHAYIPAGILIGAMVGYYFSWGMALALLGALFVSYVVRRDYANVRSFAYTGIISVLVISPYLYSVLLSFGGEDGRRAAMRTGMFYTYEWIVNTVLLATTFVVGVCFWFAYRRGYAQAAAQSWIFIGAMLAAGWLAFNEQVITGREIWYHHFVQYTVPFAYVTILAAGYLSVRRLAPRLWMYAVSTLLAGSLLYGAYSALTMHTDRMDEFRAQQDYAPLIAWLDQHASSDCVVLPVEYGDGIGRLVPAYTGCDVYYSGSAFYGVPDERTVHNYLVLLSLRRLQPPDAEQYFYEHEGEVRLYRFDDWHQLFGHGRDVWLDAKISSLVADYQEFARHDLEEQILRYRVDYIVSDTALSNDVLRRLPHLAHKDTIGRFFVYAFE